MKEIWIMIMLLTMYLGMYVCFLDLQRLIEKEIPRQVKLQTEKYSYQVMVLERENEGLQKRISQLSDTAKKNK